MNKSVTSIAVAAALITGTALVSNSARAGTILFNNLGATSTDTYPVSDTGPLADFILDWLLILQRTGHHLSSHRQCG